MWLSPDIRFSDSGAARLVAIFFPRRFFGILTIPKGFGMTLSKRTALFLFTVFLTGGVHFINALHLQKDGAVLRKGVAVPTADDASYLVPPENFIDGKGWKSNSAGDAALTTRSPGYGMIYLAFRATFGKPWGLRLMIAFQVLLYAAAVVRVPGLAADLGLTKKLGWGLALLFAVLPGFWGFLSYNLTEGVVPALVVLFLSFFLRSTRTGTRDFALGCLLLAATLLIRPAMLVWVIAPIVLSLSFPRALKTKKSLALLLLTLIPLVAWQVDMKAKTGKWQGLHPIYHDDSNTLFRPIHRDIWNYHKAWGQTGVDFHRGIDRLWRAALSGGDPEQPVRELIPGTDPRARALIGDSTLHSAYLDYYGILVKQAPYYKDNRVLSGITDEEGRLSEKFVEFRKAYVSAHPIHSFVAVPAKVFWELTGHSNLTLYVFQKSWRGNPVVEALRVVSFAIHFGAFAVFLLSMLFFVRDRKLLAVTLPILIYLLYLCVVQRGVEERYTAPVLIPVVILSACALQRVGEKRGWIRVEGVGRDSE